MDQPLSPGDSPAPSRRNHEAARSLAALKEHVAALERSLGEDLLGPAAGGPEPARTHEVAAGEDRWPVALAVVVAIALQYGVANRFVAGPAWLLPSLEAALLIGIVAANPRRINRRSRFLRAASLVLSLVITLGNAWSSFELIHTIVRGHSNISAPILLGNGAAIYLTNILVFALWFWEGDGGGPVARAEKRSGRHPAFLFPQMTAARLAPKDWQPAFVDYLYTSYTNATAFSPTDTMPLAPWAKLTMLLQSAVALTTVSLVVARAVNILN